MLGCGELKLGGVRRGEELWWSKKNGDTAVMGTKVMGGGKGDGWEVETRWRLEVRIVNEERGEWAALRVLQVALLNGVKDIEGRWNGWRSELQRMIEVVW